MTNLLSIFPVAMLQMNSFPQSSLRGCVTDENNKNIKEYLVVLDVESMFAFQLLIYNCFKNLNVFVHYCNNVSIYFLLNKSIPQIVYLLSDIAKFCEI